MPLSYKALGESMKMSISITHFPFHINAFFFLFSTSASLDLQVRLFDSVNYLKAFGVGDVWVAVGWSTDVIPIAKRSSNVAVIVPKSGASLWADLWVCLLSFYLPLTFTFLHRICNPQRTYFKYN